MKKLFYILLILLCHQAAGQSQDLTIDSMLPFVISSYSMPDNYIEVSVQDSGFTIYGDTMKVIRQLFSLYYNKCYDYDSLLTASVKFSNCVPDYWRETKNNKAWKDYWKILKKNGYYEYTPKTNKNCCCN